MDQPHRPHLHRHSSHHPPLRVGWTTCAVLSVLRRNHQVMKAILRKKPFITTRSIRATRHPHHRSGAHPRVGAPHPAAAARRPDRPHRGDRVGVRRTDRRVSGELLVPPADAREVRLHRARRAARQGEAVASRRARMGHASRSRGAGLAPRGPGARRPRARCGMVPHAGVLRAGRPRGRRLGAGLHLHPVVVLGDGGRARAAEPRAADHRRAVRGTRGRPLAATGGSALRARGRRREPRRPGSRGRSRAP